MQFQCGPAFILHSVTANAQCGQAFNRALLKLSNDAKDDCTFSKQNQIGKISFPAPMG